MPTTVLRELVQQTLASIPWQTKLQSTLPAERVPSVLHEPAILAGYRVPYRRWQYYLFSLFQLHNETVNIWSHIIGCGIILHKLYGYFHEFDLDKDEVLITMVLFSIACLVGMLTSATAHLMHSKSPFVHFVAFMGDYIGASFNSFGYGIATFYGVSEAWTYNALIDVYLPFLFVVSYLNFVNLCLAKILYGHDPHNLNRKYMFIFGMGIQYCVNMAPFTLRYVTCYCDVTCPMTSLNHLTLIQIIFMLEALAFAAHQPEKTWPGKFDIVGHGHQIFHVLIVLNHVVQLDSIYSDHTNGLLEHSKPNYVLILGLMVFLFALESVTLFYLAKFVPQCLKKVKDLHVN